MSNRTIIAFDFGTKSIGAAVGGELTGSARALPAFKAQDGSPDWLKIEKLLKEWQPDLVVVGLPLNMDGTEQPVTAQRASSPTACTAASASRSICMTSA